VPEIQREIYYVQILTKCLDQVLQGSAKCAIAAIQHFSFSTLHHAHSSVLQRIAHELPLEVESLPAEKAAKIGQIFTSPSNSVMFRVLPLYKNIE
jgi:hypothetical protein